MSSDSLRTISSCAPPDRLARILVIAGSDSSGGAGIQADIKTITALGGYAATALTALTAQNTQDVFEVAGVAPGFVAAQIRAVLDDIGVDAIKIGMLADSAIVESAAEALAACSAPIVLDPVMAATSGAELLGPHAVAALKSRLIPRAFLVTPNLREAEILTGRQVRSAAEQKQAGHDLCAQGARAALVKGGHGSGEQVEDVLVHHGRVRIFKSARIKSRNTHGTGCTLSSAIAAQLGQGQELEAACERALNFVHRAIRTAPGFGQGSGPLNHVHAIGGEAG